jgi:hypothetical protein
MSVYVYETKKIYQYTIDDYDVLWNNAIGATGPGGATVVISDYGTTVKNNSVAGINLINAWTASTISGIDGYNDITASWRVLQTGGSGGIFTGGTVSGATNFTDGLTANTISATTITATEYLNLPLSVTSVGLTMPLAFNVSNSPVISAGTISVSAAGIASQYIRGDGTLATLSTSIGGGSSVNYYLNGGTNQGVISGDTYYQMNQTPVIGSNVDFTLTDTTGYIAEFITDVNDPSLLSIPAGAWLFDMFFSASNNNGNPLFYVEFYKYNNV